MCIKSPPKELIEWQQALVASIENRPDKIATKFVCPNPKLTKQEQLTIYQNSVNAGLMNALRAAYPVTYKLVGDEYFFALASRYVLKHRPITYDITQYGDCFYVFIDSLPEVIAQLPYLSDIAKLDWKVHEILDSQVIPKESRIDLKSILNLGYTRQQQLKLKLKDNFRLICSKYPIDQIWDLNQSDNLASKTVDLSQPGVNLLIKRSKAEIYLVQISNLEYFVLANFTGKLTFEEITNKILTHCSEQEFIEIFGKFLADDGFMLLD